MIICENCYWTLKYACVKLNQFAFEPKFWAQTLPELKQINTQR